jgi:hypothetical protein
VGGREVVVEFGLCEIKLDLIESFKRRSKVNEDEVALVTELREEGGLNWTIRGSALENLEHSDGVGCDALAINFSGCVPGFPIEAEELVKQA